MVKVQEEGMSAHHETPVSQCQMQSSSPTFHFPPGFEPHGMVAEGPPQHTVDFHIHQGVTIRLQMGDKFRVFEGPVTVPMVSTNSSPPIPMPVQVPPGHMIQQVVDESGALRHVILSANPHPILPLQTHYAPGPGPGGNGPPQQFYAPGGIPPYPQHYGPFGPSPPPPHFHKDERSQRQYNKLKRKLEQKHQRGEPGPPFSPRKELANGTKGRKAASSAGTSEDGEDTSSAADLEDDSPAVLEFLSTVKSPAVSELTSRSALLTWPSLTDSDQPEHVELEIAETELIYEVLLADAAKGVKFRSIYSGRSLSCRIKDLRPGSQYSVCLKVHHEDGLQGSASPPLVITTPPCAPDAPLPPELKARRRDSLQLKWNAPPDNGAPIINYVLESDEGKGEGFVEVYRNRSKQHNVIRLQPATTYRFRIAALNECGKSAYSDAVTFSTCGSPPPPPAPPTLVDARVTSLRLSWHKRPTDEDFTLQMEDHRSGHGYLAVYNGKESSYCVEKLARHSDYNFRLRAQNEEGASLWSEEVSYRTLPAPPGQPLRPTVKGKVHASSFKARWEPPTDRGGAEISQYVLEINSGKGYEVVYEGAATEHVCDRLQPGTTYQVRVTARSSGGLSEPSESAAITTEPVCPGPCGPPRLHGRARPYSLTLKFGYPENDGGAPVTQLEVEMTSPDASKRVVHAGPETECTVSELQPGQPYLFHVRALNRAGHGPWSEGVEVLSGAAPPDAPGKPQICCRSPHTAALTWTAPPHNGAPITGYRVEMAPPGKEEFTAVYQGAAAACDVRGLQPNSSYTFRVLAINSAGSSDFSEEETTRTPPSAPGMVSSLRCSPSCSALALSWLAPSANGSDITHYNIDCVDKVLTANATEHVVEGLKPETSYRIRVQAVNAVGAGPFSSVLKTATLPLPPAPPVLECATQGHNFLKLKWGDGRNPNYTNYTVEMEKTKSNEFQVVYQGTTHTCKVSRLQELTSHRFRICASNDAGQGAWSDVVQYCTAMAPPPPVKGVHFCDVTQTSCTIEWTPCRLHSCDPVLYHAHLSRVKTQEFRNVYRGSEPRVVLNELEPGADYCVRVTAVRVAEAGEVAGPASPTGTFSTLPLATQNLAPVVSSRITHQPTDNRNFTDQQWAIIILSIFSLFAVFVAVLMQHFIDVGGQH